MDALVATLLAWIVSKTGMAAPEPPRVLLVSRSEMAARFFGSDRSQTFELQALYHCAEATILLPQNWRADDLRHASTLLHELVHHVQRTNNASLPCHAAYERQAFDLQILWLREQGVDDPHRFIDTDEFTIELISTARIDAFLSLAGKRAWS